MGNPCTFCGEDHRSGYSVPCQGKLAANILKLLDLIAAPAQCKSCHRKIFWVKVKSGKMMPVNIHGEPHFADCPQADQHRKGTK